MSLVPIHIGADITSNLTLKADVCVIGSGSGGAVVAKELAEAGAKVIVLEEGPYMPPESFSERENEMYPALYVEGAQQPTEDYLVNVLQGRVVRDRDRRSWRHGLRDSRGWWQLGCVAFA